jgi:hypothetical protein
MLNKENLRNALIDKNTELIKAELEKHPAFIRKIQRMLYDMDEQVRWGAAWAFGVASTVLEDEKMKDLIRQLVWMINEESGNNCWFAPQALGEIGRVRPELIKDFIPCLREFYKYPDSKIQEGIEYAFKRFKEAGLNIPE